MFLLSIYLGMVIQRRESLKSIEEMSEWLEKFIIQVRINNLILIGHSQGCLIALEYFNNFLNKIKKQYLLCHILFL